MGSRLCLLLGLLLVLLTLCTNTMVSVIVIISWNFDYMKKSRMTYNTRYINNETKFRNHSTVDPRPHPGNHIIDFLNRHNSCHRIITAFLLSYNLVFRYKEKINNRLILNASEREAGNEVSVNEVPRERMVLRTSTSCGKE